MKNKLKRMLALIVAVLMLICTVYVSAEETSFEAVFKASAENSFTIEFSKAVSDSSMISASTVAVKSVESGESVEVTAAEMTDSKTAVIGIETAEANIGGEYIVSLPSGITDAEGALLSNNDVVCTRAWTTATVYSQDFNKTVEYANYVDGQQTTTDWYQTAQVLNDANGTLTVSGNDGAVSTGTQYFDYLYGGGPVIADNAFEIKNVGTIRTDATSWIQKNITIDFTTDSAFTENTVIEFDAAYSFTHETVEGEAVDHTKGWFMLFDNSNGQYIFTIEGNKVRCGADWSDAAYSGNDVIEQGVPAHYKIVIDGVSNQNNAANIKDVYVNNNLIFENASHYPWAGTGGLNFRLFIDPSLKGKSVEQKLVIDNLKVTQLDAKTPAVKSVKFSQNGENKTSAISEISPLTNTVEVEFANEIDEASIDGIALKNSLGNAVTDTPSLSSDKKTVILDVTAGYLDAGADFEIYIPETVKSAGGFALLRDYSGAVKVKDERICVVKDFEIKQDNSGVKVDLSIINTEGRTDTWWLSYALYSGNMMMDMYFEPVLLTEGIVEKSLPVNGFENGNTVRAFLWNNFEKMKSIKDSVTMQ